jgi:hypothetical protein
MKRRVDITVDVSQVPTDGDQVYVNGVLIPGVINANASNQSPDGKFVSFHIVGYATSISYGVPQK